MTYVFLQNIFIRMVYHDFLENKVRKYWIISINLNIDYCIFIHVTNGLCHKRRTVQEVPYNLIYHFSGFESHFSNRVAGDSQVRRFFEQCIDALQNYLAVSEFLGDISILFFYGFYGRNQ